MVTTPSVLGVFLCPPHRRPSLPPRRIWQDSAGYSGGTSPSRDVAETESRVTHKVPMAALGSLRDTPGSSCHPQTHRATTAPQHPKDTPGTSGMSSSTLMMAGDFLGWGSPGMRYNCPRWAGGPRVGFPGVETPQAQLVTPWCARGCSGVPGRAVTGCRV